MLTGKILNLSEKRQDLVCGLSLAAITVLAYLPVWHAGFIWDDDRNLGPYSLSQIWLSKDTPQFYPIVFTSFVLEHALWGNSPAGYHILNVLIHCVGAVLVWRVLRRLELPGARLAAAIFALHPVNVESVAWVSERKNVLAMVFYLSSILAYLVFDGPRRSENPQLTVGRRKLWYALSFAFFVLGLLTKTAVAPLPLILLLLVWWRRGKLERRDLLRTAPYFLAAVALALVTIAMERQQSALFPARDDNSWSRLAIAGWAICFYLSKLALPFRLASIYPLWPHAAFSLAAFIPDLLLIAAFLVAWRYRATWGRAGLFAMGYFVLMLLPILGFLNVEYMHVSLVADRWQYFAALGPIALVAAGLTRVMSHYTTLKPDISHSASNLSLTPGFSPVRSSGSGPSRFNGFSTGSVVFIAGLLMVLGILTWRQSSLYAEPETLWRATASVDPNSWRAENYIGNALEQKGRVDEAMLHYIRADQIQLPGARSAYEATQRKLIFYRLYGNALMRKGRLDDAAAQFQNALAISPGMAEAHVCLARALMRKGNSEGAATHYRMALSLDPVGQADALADAHNELGGLLFRRGQTREAIFHLEKAIEMRPDFAAACATLAWVLATTMDDSVRDAAKALEFARRAEKLTDGRNPMALEALAAAYAECGLFPDAVTAAERAAQLADKMGNTSLKNQLDSDLARYQANLPIRSPAQTSKMSDSATQK